MKRRLGLFALLILMALGAGIGVVHHRLQAPNRRRQQFSQVQVGMTRDEVVALMGPGRTYEVEKHLRKHFANGPRVSSRWILAWPEGARVECLVALDDENQTVIDKWPGGIGSPVIIP